MHYPHTMSLPLVSGKKEHNVEPDGKAPIAHSTASFASRDLKQQAVGHAQLQTTQPGCIRCIVSSSSVLLVAHYGLRGQFYQGVRCESPWDDG